MYLKLELFALEASLFGQIFVLSISADSYSTETLYCLNSVQWTTIAYTILETENSS